MASYLISYEIAASSKTREAINGQFVLRADSADAAIDLARFCMTVTPGIGRLRAARAVITVR